MGKWITYVQVKEMSKDFPVVLISLKSGDLITWQMLSYV
jgi:hypothetical protein